MLVGLSGKKTPIMTDTGDRGGVYLCGDVSDANYIRKREEKQRGGQQKPDWRGSEHGAGTMGAPSKHCQARYSLPLCRALEVPGGTNSLPPPVPFEGGRVLYMGKTGRKSHISCCKELAGAESTASLLLPPPPRCGLSVVVLTL